MVRRRLPKLPLTRPLLAGCAACLVIAAVAGGCGDNKKKKPTTLPSRYATLPPKKVPAVFKDSLLERCDLINTEPFLVSGYSVAVNVDGGDGQAPNLVRQYIVNEMVKHKWGSTLSGIRMPSPEQALRDPRVAIVQVDGYLAPGARKGQPFDVQVSALPESNTRSLAGGDLFETDLRVMGANPMDPGGAVNTFARSAGPILVNPAYALNPKAADDPAARRSLRFGVVMNGARALEDRPLGLRLRQPSMRVSRYIEDRIDARFQEVAPDVISAAQDEGIIYFFVPASYDGDWEHFAGVVTHLYFNNAPEFAANKARELCDEAVKPDAPLMDISYAWEGLGKPALPVIQERGLMSSDSPDVAYAAARAAAFLGDPAAPEALIKMATTPGHKFQINAIQVLGSLTNSPAINEMLRPLLDRPETTVRIEAYKMLARNGDGSIFSMPVKGGPNAGGFMLDIVRSAGSPVIYATRRGERRIAIIGGRADLATPITFMTMDGHLTLSSDPTRKAINIFYRPPMPPGGARTREAAAALEPIRIVSSPDLASLIAHLGGAGEPNSGRKLNFDYGQIVAILNNLTDKQQVEAMAAGGQKLPASFMLQELPTTGDSIYNAPVISGDQGRPQGDQKAEEPGSVGMAK
jgi:hypothetical protein